MRERCWGAFVEVVSTGLLSDLRAGGLGGLGGGVSER